MGPAALAQVLRPLSQYTHPHLLVGLQTSDDAAVYRLSDELAIIQTVDFFTPIVDDPWTYGAIAAANSMSDVYAMGGEVLLALNVAAFPETLAPAIMTAIFEGGAAKVAEVGAVIAGGHTITDDEPKYGLSVTGTVHPDRIMTKGGAQPGDALFLTKPIGTGVVATALKNQRAKSSDQEAAVASMLTLNRAASAAAREAAVTACTDITGFGLIGHASEMAEKSGVRVTIRASAVPLLPGAIEYFRDGQVAGGLHRNREYFSRVMSFPVDGSINESIHALLYDPQTSGGLLIAIAPDRVAALQTACVRDALDLWDIGWIDEGTGVALVP